jgi:serine/threonine-protein kinase HipA
LKLDVYLFGNKVGELYEIKNQIYFTYDKEFLLKNIEISPLKLPLKRGSDPYINVDNIDYYHYLPGVFFDSLPDKFGTKAIEAYYEQKGTDPKSLTLLQKLAFIGKSGMGALEYLPSVFDEEAEEVLEIRALYDQTKAIIQNNPDEFITDWIKHASAFASAGGARPKVLISRNEETGVIKSKTCNEKGFEAWLLKFDERVTGANDYYGFMQLEYLYMSMAKEAGIDIPPVDLIHTDGLVHYAVKRFDRNQEEKYHLHTLASMEHINFNIPAHYSYLNALKLTDFLTNDYEQVKELFKRMVFNIIGRNQDDHAKNFSFMMDRYGNWHLAPAYDITYAFGSGYTKEHQMTINGKTSDIDAKDIYRVADAMGIPKKEVQALVEHIADIFSNFKKRASELDIPEDFADEIYKNIRWHIPKSIKG